MASVFTYIIYDNQYGFCHAKSTTNVFAYYTECRPCVSSY